MPVPARVTEHMHVHARVRVGACVHVGMCARVYGEAWEMDGKVQIGLNPDLEQWVMCEQCSKWRRLPPGHALDADASFLCNMLCGLCVSLSLCLCVCTCVCTCVYACVYVHDCVRVCHKTQGCCHVLW